MSDSIYDADALAILKGAQGHASRVIALDQASVEVPPPFPSPPSSDLIGNRPQPPPSAPDPAAAASAPAWPACLTRSAAPPRSVTVSRSRLPSGACRGGRWSAALSGAPAKVVAAAMAYGRACRCQQRE